jgi:hypothetical protein
VTKNLIPATPIHRSALLLPAHSVSLKSQAMSKLQPHRRLNSFIQAKVKIKFMKAKPTWINKIMIEATRDGIVSEEIRRVCPSLDQSYFNLDRSNNSNSLVTKIRLRRSKAYSFHMTRLPLSGGRKFLMLSQSPRT